MEYSSLKLLADMRFQEVSGHYKNFTRMSSTDFEKIIQLVGPKIMKHDTHMREAITVQETDERRIFTIDVLEPKIRVTYRSRPHIA